MKPSAQLDLIHSEKSELSHPYNWAGFALYGAQDDCFRIETLPALARLKPETARVFPSCEALLYQYVAGYSGAGVLIASPGVNWHERLNQHAAGNQLWPFLEVYMKKHSTRRKLALSKETIRTLISGELRDIVGGKPSCGGGRIQTACDCSGPSYTDTGGSTQCTYIPM